jgi:hypothetical protein
MIETTISPDVGRASSHFREPRSVLLTGATSGIGLELARHLVRRGDHVVFVGRKTLEELPVDVRELLGSPPALYCRADLSDGGAAETIRSFLDVQGVSVLDLLIHDAGAGYVGAVEKQDHRSIEELLTTNLLTPVVLTRALLPLLRKRGSIVLVGSVTAALPSPDYAAYAATKAALQGFGRSLSIELRGRARVRVVHPGATRTRMHEKSGLSPERIARTRMVDPETVSRRILSRVEGRRRITSTGAGPGLARFAGHHLAIPLDTVLRRIRRGSQARVNRKPRGKPRALVTGAAQGIGLALASKLAWQGYAVTGVDVDADRARAASTLLEDRGAEVRFLIHDLSDPADTMDLASRLGNENAYRVVIHNAGINETGPFESSSCDRQTAVLRVNLHTPLHLTARLLEHDALEEGGSLVFISSLSRFVSYPGASVYAASKDGLASYARSLRLGFVPRGIHVLTVYPGPTRTEHARRHSPDNSREERRMAPEELAHRIVRAIEKRRQVLIPGLGNKAAATLGHCLPLLTEWGMRKTLFEKMGATVPRRP